MKARAIAVLSCLPLLCQAGDATGKNPDFASLEKAFAETVGRDFELVKTIADERPVARGGETYWLAHLKPRRSGHYALKYTYRFTHEFSHPEEGETEIFIAVGEAGGHRGNNGNLGLTNILMGDTVIVPIRLDRRADHQFSLKSNYGDGPNIGKKPSAPEASGNLLSVQPSAHALEAHLRYLGATGSVMQSRAVTRDETTTWSATFEAKTPGRFNLALSTEPPDGEHAMHGIPVLIVEPGTPVTALAHRENTIHYSDNKKFSAHSGHQFITRLLILQPGDTFTLDYATVTLPREAPGKEQPQQTPPPLFIHRLPFKLDPDISHNAWLADHLPPEE